MEIRQADISDLTSLSILFDEYRQFYRQPSDVKKASLFLRDRLSQKDSTIFLAVHDASLAGFTQLYPSFSSVAMQRIYILNDLFITESARQQGVASALLRQSTEFALARGALRLTLATEITNKAAQALYEKFGWQKNETFLYYSKNL
ncbi:MAG: GNAT family N-acetyltransferase [Leptolyngbya sp. SIO1D8]|nr:GNAT family N-acetyltransferase [Leptolyngbya sp. SIO1D8]